VPGLDEPRSPCEKQHCAGAGIAPLDRESPLEQHFLNFSFPQPLGAIGTVPKKMQIRGGLCAIQCRERSEYKFQGRFGLMQGKE
jgi:hypothetical protein